MANIAYYLRSRAVSGMENDGTAKAYRDNIKKFADWAKTEKGLYSIKSVKDPVLLVQDYADYLVDSGKTAATVHTYLAPVCKGFGIRMDQIEKPVRGRVFKGTDESRNQRGQKDAVRPEAERIINAARAIGIRKAELLRLKGKNLVEINGVLHVEVLKGKGGKYQLQRILPHNEETVKELFKGVKPNQFVFSKNEIRCASHINIHRIRAEAAKEAYEYYCNQIQAGKAGSLMLELIETFKEYHPKTSDARFARQFRKYYEDMTKNLGRYCLRGENRLVAEEKGRPVTYNRLALMCVSVWHLSHWRCDVTVKHYLNK